MRLFLLAIFIGITPLSRAVHFNKMSASDDLHSKKTGFEDPHITILYRWNKSDIDTLYLSNRQQLERLDALLNPTNAFLINSLSIVAYASPEGDPEYNQNLSQKRANTLKEYITRTYKHIDTERIETIAGGENWEGLLRFALNDPDLPSRKEVLKILNAPISDRDRQDALTKLEGGKVYYNYILPKYYRFLRNGSSVFIMATPHLPVVCDEPEVVVLPEAGIIPIPEPSIPVVSPRSLTYNYIRPFALKTNLLFDMATLFNVELEIPIAKRFSVAAEWVFPWWGGLGNRGGVSPLPAYSEKYTLQMLSGNLEGRYWFPRGERLDRKARQWSSDAASDYNPLNGWFIGPYAGYGLYDFQLGGDGLQGDFYIAAGITGGFAHPVGKNFHMEYAIGAGYLRTEYKQYTPIEGHKVFQHSGRYTWIGPTKAKVSLVWTPRFKLKEKKGGKW